MLENFKDVGAEHRENIIKDFRTLVNGFKNELDWRYLRKLHDQSDIFIIDRTPTEQNLFLQHFLGQIFNIKKMLIWKTGKKFWEYVESVLQFFEAEQRKTLIISHSV